uniref:ORF3 n=1 Tax=Nitrosopumilaceae spindle-shaped virus TaxID=3065433 RepID=A0AAT9JAZ2_9VIRU
MREFATACYTCTNVKTGAVPIVFTTMKKNETKIKIQGDFYDKHIAKNHQVKTVEISSITQAKKKPKVSITKERA